ncbi:phosphatidylserine/phosphatidylglycerophosphate/cardiolipin synthase family protein [Haloferax namakaokahaiae]|uniref:Phosphatidylserine/phosphatidylglycerophosphate/ cardiolipin synthase family protein n=1 Tax=Haloferax namakaokahaiae TaxID=1748331 RepID=A0ABD5ZFR4_9EURY
MSYAHRVVLVLVLVCPAVVASPAAATPPTAAVPTATPSIETVSNATTAAVSNTTTAAIPDATTDGATVHVVAFLPNPTTPDDRGEFVVVSAPEGTNVTLDDGEGRVSFVAPGGDVAVTSNPAYTSNLTDTPVVSPGLELANGRETVTLSVNGSVRDRFSYTRAEEGAVATRTEDGWSWWPRALPKRPVTTHGSANATVFTLPDSPEIPKSTLREADTRILLAGYVVTSPAVADELVAAQERGVHVEVLVDDAPVGGFSRQSAQVLDRLASAGVTVRVVGDPHSFHHPKYAVVDNRALVMTENWKPSGTGGNKSRGWGVIVHSASVAADLARTFEDDSSLPQTRPWSRFERRTSFVDADSATGSYPSRSEPTRVAVDSVAVLRAPDNAEGAVVRRLDSTDDRIDVIQPTVEPESPFVFALKRAAERGVRVRLLLGSVWYVEDENRRLADELNAWAERTGNPLSVRLARPAGRYGAIHAKGVVADDTVLVGSLNWNRHSARENREVVVALESAGAAAYYRRVFDADWRASNRGPRPELVALAVCAVLVGVVALRKIEFES